MKKNRQYIRQYIFIFAIFILAGAIVYQKNEAMADIFGLNFIFNSPGNNATTTLAVAPGSGLSSSSVLRYPANGATTTLPLQAATGENQNGLNIVNAQSITLAYQTVGSTSPYTARFEVEYGYDVPLSTNPNTTSIQWFNHNFAVSGPMSNGFAHASSSQNLSASELATSTPHWDRNNLGTATTSEVIELPVVNAKYIRIHATPIGSQAMFWLNAIIKYNK